MPIEPELLKIIVCPSCREELRESGEWLLCMKCRKKYPVTENIPVLLPEKAVPLDKSK